MKINRVALLVALSLFVAEARAQTERSETADKFVLHFLPENTKTDGLAVFTAVGGSFGLSVEESGKKVVDHHLAIPVDQVQSLKVIVFRPHYQTFVLSVLPLAEKLRREAEIELQPSASVQFSGRVALPADVDAASMVIEVDYECYWGMRYLGYIDGPAPGFHVASMPLAADGTFSAAIPDFWHDPVISAYNEERGFLRLALSRKTGDEHGVPYRLKLPGKPADLLLIKVAEQYQFIELETTTNSPD